MSRFTYIFYDNKSIVKGFYETLDKYYRGKYISYRLIPGVMIVLSNSASRSEHYELYRELTSEYSSLNTRIISVVHTNPVYTLIKARKLVEKNEFYYEDHIEKEYYIGYITPISKNQDPLVAIAFNLKTILETSLYLLNLSSLPLYISNRELIIALNPDTIGKLELLKTMVEIGIGVDYNSNIALRKAIESIKA